MTTQKKPEDMTLAEIKEQMALYCRLYYHKRKEEDPEYMDIVRARKRITGKALHHKKEAEREAKETEEKKGDEDEDKPKYHHSRKYKHEYAMVAVAN